MTRLFSLVWEKLPTLHVYIYYVAAILRSFESIGTRKGEIQINVRELTKKIRWFNFSSDSTWSPPVWYHHHSISLFGSMDAKCNEASRIFPTGQGKQQPNRGSLVQLHIFKGMLLFSFVFCISVIDISVFHWRIFTIILIRLAFTHYNWEKYILHMFFNFMSFVSVLNSTGQCYVSCTILLVLYILPKLFITRVMIQHTTMCQDC
jgi:hypothetical protein